MSSLKILSLDFELLTFDTTSCSVASQGNMVGESISQDFFIFLRDFIEPLSNTVFHAIRRPQSDSELQELHMICFRLYTLPQLHHQNRNEQSELLFRALNLSHNSDENNTMPLNQTEQLRTLLILLQGDGGDMVRHP